jgi:glycosyltransferase involved in cell wall biosynthesis
MTNRTEPPPSRRDDLPVVSVVFAAYNAQHTLAAAVESALAQTYPYMEVVVVDDGSTDGTADVIRRFGNRVRAAWQPNAGLANARNLGCRLARGELLALMDADDLCSPERIAWQVQVFRRFPETILCGSDFSAFAEGGEVSSSFGTEYYSALSEASGGLAAKYKVRETLAINSTWSTTPVEDEFVEVFAGAVYPELAFGNFVHPPTVMLRRDALFDVGLFDESIRYNSDWECFVRLSRVGSFAHIGRSLLAYRLSAAQMSSSVGNKGRGAADLVRTFDKVCLADSELIRDQTDRVLACQRQFCADAARVLVESARTEAARMLWKSAASGGIDGEWLKTLCKLALPGALLRVARRIKSG